MTDQERIEQIKARCDAATKGAWRIAPGGFSGASDYVPTFSVHGPPSDFMYLRSYEDADFIAHSREDIPLLLDLLSQAEAERERLEKALKDVIDTICRPGSTADEVFNFAHLAWLKAKETPNGSR